MVTYTPFQNINPTSQSEQQLINARPWWGCLEASWDIEPEAACIWGDGPCGYWRNLRPYNITHICYRH